MQSPRLSVWVIVYDFTLPKEPLFLLARRSSKANNSKQWNLFGGRCSKGECLLSASKRELFEESGIRVESLDFVVTKEEDNNLYNYHSLALPSIISPILNDESDDYGWFNIGQINSLNLHAPTKLFFHKKDSTELKTILKR